MTDRPECQKCSSDLKYIQRMYEYHCVYEASEDSVELSTIDDSVMDEEYEPHLHCETCDEPRTHEGLPRPKKKFNVVIAVMFSEPQSYDLEEVVVEAYDEDEAMKFGEQAIEERIEKDEGSTHNVAGFHRWFVNEKEEEEDGA